MKRLIFFFLSILLPMQVFAQVDRKDVMKQRAREMVFLLNDQIHAMTKPELSVENRYRHKDAALRLFVGGGNKFEYVNSGVQSDGVKVEALSTNAFGRTFTNTRLVRDYFTRLIMMSQREVSLEVKITDADICYLMPEKTKQVEADLYEHTYEIIALSEFDKICWEGHPHYVRVLSNEAEPSVMLLGDIKVTETRHVVNSN